MLLKLFNFKLEIKYNADNSGMLKGKTFAQKEQI